MLYGPNTNFLVILVMCTALISFNSQHILIGLNHLLGFFTLRTLEDNPVALPK